VDRFVYISEEQRRQFQEDFRLPARRLTGIYNGVGALNAVRQKQGAAFTIAMAARGSIPEKGWLALIRAFQQLRGDVRLLLIGEGEYLQGLARSFAADERIIFAGFHPQPARLIASADIFVLPTTYAAESLPTVIIEALSVGRPVIATSAGEITAMLTTQQGPAGTLLPLSDEQSLVQNISRAVQCYIDNPQLLEEHSARARDAFKPFDMMTCTARYQNLYAEVIEEGGRSSPTRASH
jgi:glycosyltransferase involved in cell wall biosynthesis